MIIHVVNLHPFTHIVVQIHKTSTLSAAKAAGDRASGEMAEDGEELGQVQEQ